jgi:mannose-6-phosphate isomerase
MTSRAEPRRRDLLEAREESLQWLLNVAAPSWQGRSLGRHYLFPERLTLRGEADICPHRLFVQARHVYAYCEIGRLGWPGPWRDMVEQSTDFLLKHGKRPDGLFIHSFDETGKQLDKRADLYDQAFMLLALAFAGRATARNDFLAAAEHLDDVLEARWRGSHGGYHEGEIAQCPPYRQNPHMHLLEGFIALYRVTGEKRWRKRAETIVDLCASSFLDPRTGALLEYFDERLKPRPGLEGRTVEPGHCFEWAWLMEKLANEGVYEALDLSGRLADFARAYGIDPLRGVTINEITTDGAVLNPDARLWPQTERLKCALVRFGRTGSPDEASEAVAAYRGLARYLDDPIRGVWRDKLRPDGSWIEEPAPGSSLYHITCALAEMQDSVPDRQTLDVDLEKAG